MVTVITASDLNTALEAANIAASEVADDKRRLKIERYAQVFETELNYYKGTLLQGELEDLINKKIVIRVIHHYVKNLGTVKYPWCVRQFDVIPLTSVGRKRNIIYVVEDRIG